MEDVDDCSIFHGGFEGDAIQEDLSFDENPLKSDLFPRFFIRKPGDMTRQEFEARNRPFTNVQ